AASRASGPASTSPPTPPRTPSPSSRGASASIDGRPRLEAMPRNHPNVLLVDDVEANLIVLEALLGGLDCELVRATSGNEALRQLLKREFAVILLDVQMPGMDGFEVARYARDNPKTK